eukprot:TRINITY_DN3878_c0_g1_i6.p2 TRINITY_DN3878_c0_g1~~TRINITY_DN3878_c0_g1_i6.p2  ORF type:complete len:238 (-),score=52.90 TRINITY_DN3878_c0_g1_i6:1500-2213(-)
MAPQSLIYSFVARGKTVVAEFSAYVGNFNQVAQQCLNRLSPDNKKATYVRDGFAFNFLTENAFTYCLVTEESFPRAVTFAFLSRIRDDFMSRFGGGKAESAFEHTLDRQYGPILKKEMEFCESSPSEVEKVAGVRAQMAEVKNVMLNNIDAVMSRGIKLDDLQEKTTDLQRHAQNFQDTGRRIRSKMWYDNLKAKAAIIIILIIVAIIIWVSVCHGFSCSSGNSTPTTTSPSPPPPV